MKFNKKNIRHACKNFGEPHIPYLESLLYKPGPSEQRTYCTYYDVKDEMSHKVLIQYRVPQCLSPRRNWASPTPALASEYAPLPETKGGGGTLACR